MLRHALRRLLWLGPILLGVSMIVYATLLLVPGDPAVTILGPYATPEKIADLRTQLGLDRPFLEQYALWIGGVLRGDFGWSYAVQRPVAAELADRAGPTLLLAGVAFLLSAAGGLVLGTLAAARQNGAADRTITIALLAGLSTPAFFLGLVMVLVFAVWLAWLPPGGMMPVWGPVTVGSILARLAMPAATLTVIATAIIARVMRTSTLETLRLDYVRAARARGLDEWRVLWRHVFRNAVVPVIPVVALQAGFLIGGAVYVETVFQWPGLGRMLVDAIKARDILLVQGGVLVIAAAYVLINLAADLVQIRLDRRLA